MLERTLWVGFAGALGSITRYWVGILSARWFADAFPYGTLVVNLIGSFLLCLIMGYALAASHISPLLRIALTTGFLGGLTTYSSFNYETLVMFRDGQRTAAVANVVITMLGALVFGLAGLWLAKRL